MESTKADLLHKLTLELKADLGAAVRAWASGDYSEFELLSRSVCNTLRNLGAALRDGSMFPW